MKQSHLNTVAFMGILCGGNLTIYLTRNRGFVWSRPLPEWKFFCATLFSLIVGSLISVYGIPGSGLMGIGWSYVGCAWIYILVWFVITMFTKLAFYRIFRF